MLGLLSSLVIAQTPPVVAPAEIVRSQVVRPLPGNLDAIPTFNSNSPEVVTSSGILLSTFPPDHKAVPTAHLNLPLQGRFDIFAHHIARPPSPNNLTSIYLGILVHNPTNRPVTITTFQAASYLTQPEAPFANLPPLVEFTPEQPVYAGPGSRAMGDILLDRRDSDFPPQVIVPPQSSLMLYNQPIPVRTLASPINGRSMLVRVQSDGPVYLASMSMVAPVTWYGIERPPSLLEWEILLNTADLVTPRDRVPTPIDGSTTQVIYGRVAGVARGTRWEAEVTDAPHTARLTIPEPGQAFSYGISTLYNGRLGTDQIQSAPMLVRYPDTAYQAHGNYGIEYDLTFPLYNPTGATQTVVLRFETPIKEDTLSQGGLRFFAEPEQRVFFRGPMRIRYVGDDGAEVVRYVHLVMYRGQQGEALATLSLPARQMRTVSVQFLYPADSTPPQVLTIETLPAEGSTLVVPTDTQGES